MAFTPQAAFTFLRRAFESDRLAHAYLITGEAGSGKRELVARLTALVTRQTGPRGGQLLGFDDGPADAADAPIDIAETLRHPDVHSIEPESKSRVIKVEQTRELEKELQMRASQTVAAGGGRHEGRKVAVIFDADRMNVAASNSFLKTLEEPPAHSLLLLVTAHPEMLLETILSRCILVQLATPPRRDPGPAQRRLLDLIGRFMGKAAPQNAAQSSGGAGLSLGEVFILVREFTRLLAEAKGEIQDEGAAELKREEGLYKQTTDGKWLAEREEYYKALAEARYLEARHRAMETLLQWWGDILRQRHGGPGQGGGQSGDPAPPVALDFPDYAAQTAALARRFSTPETLRRIGALEKLRENFTRNVQEQLAIEVAFLEAFG